jgi:hypothetical protein
MPQVAFRAVRSRQVFNKAPQIVASLRGDMQRIVKPHFEKEFDKRVANWDHKPEFGSKGVFTGEAIIVYVFPAGSNKKYWVWNVEGTRPHKIRAKRAPSLAFNLGYQPKTSARPYYYGGPGTASGPLVFAKEVNHPGTEPRPHVEVIKQQNKSWYSKTMENAWRRAIRRA